MIPIFPASRNSLGYGERDLCAMLRTACSIFMLTCSLAMHAQDKPKDACCAAKGTGKTELSCKLTTEELRHRKETVIASLKFQVIERKELEHGYAYTFPGSDKMLDELAEFIKTERECCSFFSFGLTVKGDKSMACLELTGPEGAKDMIVSELGL